jgi:PhnB protein
MKIVKVNPYLLVENGKEAIKLYKDLFGAKLLDHRPATKELGQRFGFPEDYDYANSTMHAELEINGATIMLADNIRGKPGSGNVQVYVTLDSKKQLEKINEKVQEKKFSISIPMGKTFWGSWLLIFEDPYGIVWQIAFSEE